MAGQIRGLNRRQVLAMAGTGAVTLALGASGATGAMAAGDGMRAPWRAKYSTPPTSRGGGKVKKVAIRR